MPANIAPNPRIFEAAIFDLDGLLMDSEPIWVWAQMKVFRDRSALLTEEIQHATTGMRMHEAVVAWRRYFPGVEIDPAAIRRDLLELVRGKVLESGQPKPGAVQAVEICREAGCKVAIASSSMPELIAASVERMGLRDHFQALVSTEKEAHGKPHPAVYLSAAARLGVDPEACIGFEDSIFGVQAVKAAGIYCVAVPEAHNRGRSEYAVADRIPGSLEEFRSGDLRREMPG